MFLDTKSAVSVPSGAIPALGVTQIEGGGNLKGGRVLMNLNLVDAGELLDSAKVALAPLVYYGSGESAE